MADGLRVRLHVLLRERRITRSGAAGSALVRSGCTGSPASTPARYVTAVMASNDGVASFGDGIELSVDGRIRAAVRARHFENDLGIVELAQVKEQTAAGIHRAADDVQHLPAAAGIDAEGVLVRAIGQGYHCVALS